MPLVDYFDNFLFFIVILNVPNLVEQHLDLVLKDLEYVVCLVKLVVIQLIGKKMPKKDRTSFLH